MMEFLIDYRKVSKTLGKLQVLQEIDLQVKQGEVIGIIGANGSGKTTLLRLALGMMYPNHGEVLVGGKKVRPGLVGELPLSVGALIESPTFLPQFSGLKNLLFLAGIRDQIKESQVREVMKQVGLDPDNRKAVKHYSLGMRQRLGIAQAIMEQPDMLLFDEPTNGLDDAGVEMFAAVLRERTEAGAAVMLVSHVQDEIKRFCDKVYRLQEGKLQLVSEEKTQNWLIIVRNLEDMEIVFHEIPSFEMGKRVNDMPAGTCRGEWSSKEELVSFLLGKGVQPLEIKEVS